MGQLTRVIPHRVNTVGKLQQAIADGYRAFEVDLVFSSRDGGVYDVGHDAGSMAGIEIGELLATLGRGRIQKVWFDLKNLTEANLQQQMRTLTALDARFGLRDTVIVETSMESDSLRQVAALGFHTSYYLPTDRILQLLSDGQAEQLREEAILIAKQVRRQEVSAVSFDARLYPFVKKDLEPLIPKHIVYHTWDLSLALSHPDVVEQLRETSYFGDSRIRTILLPYQSPFSL